MSPHRCVEEDAVLENANSKCRRHDGLRTSLLNVLHSHSSFKKESATETRGRKLEQNICLWSEYLITNYFWITKVRNSVSSGTFPVVQCLGRHASTAGGVASASGVVGWWGGGLGAGGEGATKISRASQCSQKKKRNSDFTVEKPGRYYLTQVFRVDIIRMGRVGIL